MFPSECITQREVPNTTWTTKHNVKYKKMGSTKHNVKYEPLREVQKHKVKYKHSITTIKIDLTNYFTCIIIWLTGKTFAQG